jgi:hypothetical protein
MGPDCYTVTFDVLGYSSLPAGGSLSLTGDRRSRVPCRAIASRAPVLLNYVGDLKGAVFRRYLVSHEVRRT